jgi:hypothetical protein
VKFLGWIKNAFVKAPAGPSKAEPRAEAPPAIDSRTVPEAVDADAIADRAINHDRINTADVDAAEPAERLYGPIGAVPERRISVESGIESSVEPKSRIAVETDGVPDQQEIDRRRQLVREFFNDYWSTADDKPTSFAERLDRAEGYINERVAAGGEAWRLSPATRKQLGLPPSRNR